MLLIAEQTDIHEVSGIDHRSMGWENASHLFICLASTGWDVTKSEIFWQDFPDNSFFSYSLQRP